MKRADRSFTVGRADVWYGCTGNKGKCQFALLTRPGEPKGCPRHPLDYMATDAKVALGQVRLGPNSQLPKCE